MQEQHDGGAARRQLPGGRGLLHAGLLSAPRAGVALGVAGVTISVRSPTRQVRLAVAGCATRFLLGSGTPDLDLTLDAEWRPLRSDTGRLVFDSGGAWRLYEHDGREVYRVFDSRLGA